MQALTETTSVDVRSQPRYQNRRGELQEYFDCTALDNWRALTSDAPVSRIRQTVRDGRDAMRAVLLGWLPEDLLDQHVLDAGCGTGALSLVAAERGAQVTAVDLSPNLIELARTRVGAADDAGSIRFVSGDMLSAEFGTFDHVVCMDSLIHYQMSDTLNAVESLASRCTRSVAFTVAPATRLLRVMHQVGQWLPQRNDRSPDIVPVAIEQLCDAMQQRLSTSGWQLAGSERISSGFYTSHALRLERQ
ncbi:MAG: magnesium protoporphyrin IX methyltransferase [Pseudomonadales bacterium]